MTKSGQYLTDLLDIVPEQATWKIYSINEELDELTTLLKDFEPRTENLDLVIELTRDRKEIIKRLIIKDSIDEKIIHMQFWDKGRKLYEGFDHLDYGSIIEELSTKNNFKDKYIDTDLCTILKED